MPIEANVEVIMARASDLSGKARELETTLGRFIRARQFIADTGQSLSGAQKGAAIGAATRAAQEVNVAANDLQAAWAATQPIVIP